MSDEATSLSAFARQHRITLEQAEELFAGTGPGLLEFDEALYLEENPYVRRSIANGEFKSALLSYSCMDALKTEAAGRNCQMLSRTGLKARSHRARCANASTAIPSSSPSKVWE